MGFMDVIDEVMPARVTHIGLLTGFAQVPLRHRASFVVQNRQLIQDALEGPIGDVLDGYDDHPAAWLLEAVRARPRRASSQRRTRRLRAAVRRLLIGRGRVFEQVILAPFRRLMKLGKVKFARATPMTRLLTQYPRCSAADRHVVESTARQFVLLHFSSVPQYSERAWPRAFWTESYRAVPCCSGRYPLSNGRGLRREDATTVSRIVRRNMRLVRDYLADLSDRPPVNPYGCLQQDVVLGLVSRSARLYQCLLGDDLLWSRDLGGILLRCLSDNAITLAYLVKRGTSEEFAKFRAYGQGQEKLWMLHLQDNYPADRSLEGRDPSVMSEQLGGIAVEMQGIDLAGWTDKNMRQLARESGALRLYHLVFAPASGDVHGTWPSLERSNLTRCMEPLHRFHYLPAIENPPLFAEILAASGEMMTFVTAVVSDAMAYPPLRKPLAQFDALVPMPPSKQIRPRAGSDAPSRGN